MPLCGIVGVSTMAVRISRFSRFAFSVLWLLLVLYVGGSPIAVFGQDADRKATIPSEGRNTNRPYRRDDSTSNWNQRGRTIPGQSPAGLRLRAYRRKMAMRAERATATASTSSSDSVIYRAGNSSSSPALWAPLGPAPLASDATGDGMQDYNWVSGRATSVLIDPADNSGNTVLLGGAYGGLWKSTNAGSMNSNPAAVTWQALIDDQPTLAVGAIALQPGNSKVILVGTGETNSAGDSYYGLGMLRSADGGSTWTQISSAASGQSFLGIGFSKIAFSSSNPSLVVAATAGDKSSRWHKMRARVFVARGEDADFPKAALDFARVLQIDGGTPEIHEERAKVCWRAGQFADVLEGYQKSMELGGERSSCAQSRRGNHSAVSVPIAIGAACYRRARWCPKPASLQEGSRGDARNRGR